MECNANKGFAENMGQNCSSVHLPKRGNNGHRHSDNDQPWDHPVEIHLQRVGSHLLVLESVDEPNSHVEQYQEYHYLPSWPFIVLNAFFLQNLKRNKRLHVISRLIAQYK